MVLKRKRSDSGIGSVFSSTENVGSNCFNFDALSAMDTARRGFFAPRLSTTSHLPSRTMKRFRDNRPSETEVHQHTLDVLFSAQRRAHEHQYAAPESPKATNTSAFLQIPAQPYHTSQQRSLHNFWSLPGLTTSTSSLASSPSSSAVSPPSPALAPRSTPTDCEDCGLRLAGGDDGDVMMDIDGYGSGPDDHICGACGKAVCFSCSISNLGEHRRCLACAGPRGGVGGSQWLRR
ncbi:hypothetical protein F5144DRAFT_373475 [Chaetomium tenue]|uniref:Uncharacterized protein n=1 Tax=Chaetomium tenue TaxID=1854479 RepID=A0ACB7P2T2_9PEZI|nr:hypothetical protein F5144DRAFT_373475 [Chaetomium globosum]